MRSLSHAIAAAQVRGLAPERWEVQMLMGMADALAEAVAASGVKLRMYVPMGDLLAGIWLLGHGSSCDADMGPFLHPSS